MARRSRSKPVRNGAATLDATGAGATPTPTPLVGSPLRPRLATAWLVVSLVLLAVVVFAPVRQFDFVQIDDPLYVSENPHIAGGFTMANVAWAMTTGHAGYWMPAVWLSYLADVAVYGPGAAGHHVTNLLLHIVSTILLFGWLASATGSRGRSWVVAALFAVHPLHVESVAWITERKDVLSGVFWMGAMWAYVAYVRRPSWRRDAAVAALFPVGLAAKPNGGPLGRLAGEAGRVRRCLVEKLPLATMAIAGSVVAFVAQDRQGAVSSLKEVTAIDRIGHALVSYVSYLKMTVWPSDLAFFYPLPAHVAMTDAFVASVVLAVITAVALVGRTRWPWIVAGWFWYLITLVPVIGLVQVGIQARADRFMYLPAVGLFVLATWSMFAIAGPTRWRPLGATVIALAVVAANGVAARQQLWYWKDSVTLFSRASMVTLGVDEFQAHMQLGTLLRGQSRLAEASDHFAAAARLRPDSADARLALGAALNDLGALQSDQGDYEKAILTFREALRIDPALQPVHVNLGLALVKSNRLAEALPEFREALRLEPNDDLARRAVESLAASSVAR
jgi:protein O-mannosyl-transferase